LAGLSSSRLSRSQADRYCLAGFLIVQFLLVSLTFPLPALWSAEPLFYIDNAAHWYRTTFAVNIGADGLLTGYDPYFNAGTMAGIAANSAAKVPAGLAFVMQAWLDPIVAWKLYVFASSLLACLCVPVALILLRTPLTGIVSGGIFALLLWWVSVFRWYHTAGMASFVLAAYLALPFVGWIARYLLGTGGWRSLVGLGLFGAVGLYVHPLFPLPIVVWTVVFLAVCWRDVGLDRVAKLIAVVPALSLFPSLPWLVPVFFEQPLTQHIAGVRHQSYVGWDMILREPLGVWAGPVHGSKMYSLLILASSASLWLTSADRYRRLVYVFTIVGLLLVLYAGLGASIETAARLTQPNRFAPVAYLFLSVPAAYGAVALLGTVRGSLPRTGRTIAITMSVCCAILLLVNLNELRRELATDEAIGHYGAHPPEVRGTGPYTDYLLNWLLTETRGDARILFEVSRGRIVDEGHMAAFLAYTSDRELIGGHYPDSYFADFTDGRLFGRSIKELDEDDFRKYADLYNLGWVVAYTPDSKMVFDGFSILQPMGEFREFAMYRVDRPHDYFVSGTGRVVERAHNRLVLDGLAGDEVILGYHYMRGLVSDPPVELQPIHLLGDPNPFIRIENPPEQLTLSFR